MTLWNLIDYVDCLYAAPDHPIAYAMHWLTDENEVRPREYPDPLALAIVIALKANFEPTSYVRHQFDLATTALHSVMNKMGKINAGLGFAERNSEFIEFDSNSGLPRIKVAPGVGNWS